jgi:hypothetical protein
VLLKIVNVNLYSMLKLDDYEGPNLPDDFKLGDYTDVIDILILFLLNINKHKHFFNDLLDFNSKKKQY